MPFVQALKKDELAEGKGKCLDLKGHRIAVFRTPAGYFAFDDECTHDLASLAEGTLVDECTVECPWHGAQFDIKTGEAKTMPAVEPVKTYKTRIEGDYVEVEIEG